MHVKMAKIRFRKKCSNFGTNKVISMKICYNNFMTSYYAMYLLKHLRNQPSKSVIAVSGRAGSDRFEPGRFIADIGSTSKKKTFLFSEPHS